MSSHREYGSVSLSEATKKGLKQKEVIGLLFRGQPAKKKKLNPHAKSAFLSCQHAQHLPGS